GTVRRERASAAELADPVRRLCRVAAALAPRRVARGAARLLDRAAPGRAGASRIPERPPAAERPELPGLMARGSDRRRPPCPIAPVRPTGERLDVYGAAGSFPDPPAPLHGREGHSGGDAGVRPPVRGDRVAARLLL